MIKRIFAATLAAAVIGLPAADIAQATSSPGVYTLSADFDEGTLINVNHDTPDQLQLIDKGEAFDFIWVAASARGTIIKIDTKTGTILGEYQSAPNDRGRDPSRTTVDANGNVWTSNRAEGEGGRGSVIHIGLKENGQCEDRNHNGVIDTSTGLGDIKGWSNPGGVDNNGGVTSADDECIIHYVRTGGTNVRTVAVDGSNNVWIGGLGNRVHELYDADGNLVPGSGFNLGCGGYGGQVDEHGILWSAGDGDNSLLRYDPVAHSGTCIPLGRFSYGLGIDTSGNIWNSNYDQNSVTKIAPDGSILGTFPTGGATDDRGVAVTPADNDVWVASSGGSDVSRLNNDGVLKAVIPVGNAPMGVAVDGDGKVWVTNYNSDNAMRIDPATNSVDKTVALGAGAGPYNYSDMTGSTLTAPPDSGTWSVVYDSTLASAPWSNISWNADEPGNSSLTVTVASSEDNVTFTAPVAVANGATPAVANGRYLKVNVAFKRSTDTDTGDDDDASDHDNDDAGSIFPGPVLYDLTATAVPPNQAPVCTKASPSINLIWSPNHKFVPVQILGLSDPDGDALTVRIDSIFQDEPTNTEGDGNFSPDGKGIGSDTAQVRAERVGTPKVPGNGRVYHIGYTATDPFGAACSGAVTVGVPHDQGKKGSTPVDGGALYDSTL